MKYITILDFEIAEVHIFPYKEKYGENFAEIIERIEQDLQEVFGFTESNCQWMIGELKLRIH